MLFKMLKLSLLDMNQLLRFDSAALVSVINSLTFFPLVKRFVSSANNFSLVFGIEIEYHYYITRIAKVPELILAEPYIKYSPNEIECHQLEHIQSD